MAETPKELIAPPWSRVEWSIMLAAREIRRTFDEVFLDFDLNPPWLVDTEVGEYSYCALWKSLFLEVFKVHARILVSY